MQAKWKTNNKKTFIVIRNRKGKRIMRYFLHLEYNGKNYHGWQRQDNGVTVQEVLEVSMSNVLGKEIVLFGCGRTDTGVHARDFYAHFDYDELEKEEIDFLIKKLNSYLPYDINIKELLKVKSDANARFSAISRTYKYYISTTKNPFNCDFSYYSPYKLNVEKMNTAAKTLYQYTDFSSFCKSKNDAYTHECRIMFARCEEKKDYIVFTIKANRFLRNMVRAIIGTLIEVGREKMTVDDFMKVIEAKDRRKAGESMPANALFLEEVEYDKRIFLEKMFIY
jgi:tRNA pseudouridine38-40 synthase